MKSPLPYLGGKTRLAPTIAAMLPPHTHYVEPFAGSLTVLLAKPPSRMESVNDLDGDLVVFWRILRDRPQDLARVCALTPHARAEYATACHGDPPADDLERARRVWVQLTQSRAAVRSRTTRHPPGWRHYVNPAGSSSGMPDYLAGYVDRLAPAADRLAAVSLECRPALDLVDRYGAEPGVLLYCDPPYLGGTRRSGGYACDMRTRQEHMRLLDTLRQAAAAVVLSGYPSVLYERALADWWRYALPTSTGQRGTWAGRTEVLWSNRPLTGQPPLPGLDFPPPS